MANGARVPRRRSDGRCLRRLRPRREASRARRCQPCYARQARVREGGLPDCSRREKLTPTASGPRCWRCVRRARPRKQPTPRSCRRCGGAAPPCCARSLQRGLSARSADRRRVSAGRPRSTRRALPGVVRSIRRLAARTISAKGQLAPPAALGAVAASRCRATLSAGRRGLRRRASGRSQGDAVAAAFLEAVTPAGVAACSEAIGELERAHQQRLEGQRLAVERAQFEADRAERQFDACEPENRLVGRTLERAWERSSAAGVRAAPARRARGPSPRAAHRRRARGAGAARARPPPAVGGRDDYAARSQRTAAHADQRSGRDGQGGPRRAESTSPGRAAPHRAAGSADPPRPRAEPHREDTVELIRQLAAHSSDQQIAAILNKQGRLPARACCSTSRASSTFGSSTRFRPRRRRTPTAAWSRSNRPRPSSASAARRSTAG